jgi:23S rRNA (adenine2030-N6)-methyltransferase
MLSYRHGFHAGNHADVLKHVVALSTLDYMLQKPAPIFAIDTHAGAGVYALDSAHAQRSGEAQTGIRRVWRQEGAPPEVQRYTEAIASFNVLHNERGLRFYPGSPALIWGALRTKDRLRLFELHPTDFQVLEAAVSKHTPQRQVRADNADGFEGLKSCLPPAQRRAFVLIDPPYEIKQDYTRVIRSMGDALLRFPGGTYVIWYPKIDRPESRRFAAELAALAPPKGGQVDWVHASLNIGAQDGLMASGVFVFNPPYVLHDRLCEVLPWLVAQLGIDASASHELHKGHLGGRGLDFGQSRRPRVA